MGDESYLTPEEVELIAMRENHALLYACVQQYRSGKLTWPEAMQGCAVYLSRINHQLTTELIKLRSERNGR